MMGEGEYISAFAAILVGLALADIVTSFQRLLRARARVKWDWLPLAVACLVILSIVQLWWAWFALWVDRSSFSFAWFLPHLLHLLIVFLLASATLPDELPAGKFDLGKAYFADRRYFWGLFAIYLALATILKASRISDNFENATFETLVRSSQNILYITFSMVLMFTARRWVHGLFVLIMLIALCLQWMRNVAIGS